MRVGEVEKTQAGNVGSMRDGVLSQKFLLMGEDGSPNNYSINVGRTGSGGWTTPRHRHNFDQVRYVLKGTYPYAKGKVMTEGTVGYYPEGVPYGPQDRPEGLEMMVCQFGGASGQGYIGVQEREAANARLARRGTFKEGIFTWYDENGQKHNQDGFEACFEEVMGRKLVYPRPRYEDIVLMHPDNYEWVADAAQPGVAHKWMGIFGERMTKIGFVRIDAGAIFGAGTEESLEVMFLAEGSVTVDGKEYGPRSAFEFKAKEGPVAMKAREDAKLLRMVMPKF